MAANSYNNYGKDKQQYSFEDDVKVGWEAWFDQSVKRCINSPDLNSYSLAVDMLEAFVTGYKMKVQSRWDDLISLQDKKYPPELEKYFKAVDREKDRLVQVKGVKDVGLYVDLYRFKFILLLSMIQTVTAQKVVVTIESAGEIKKREAAEAKAETEKQLKQEVEK